MHITLETDYALRILYTLMKEKQEGEIDTRHPNRRGRLDAGKIAEISDVPPRFALKILRKLAAGGLVVSYKGVYGGYEFAPDPAGLSVYDVVELVEGEYRFCRCLDESYSCGCSEPCAFQNMFSQVSDMVKEYLKSKTFDKL